MPPKKRDAENDTGKKPRAKKQKKKDEFDDESEESEEEQNNGNGAAAEPFDEIDSTYDISIPFTSPKAVKMLSECQTAWVWTLEAPMLSGELLMCGQMNWDLVGRRSTPKGVKTKGGPSLWRPHRVADLAGIKIRSVHSGCSSAHSVVVTDDGKVYTFGRNEKGQLGIGNIERTDKPTLVECLTPYNIIDASAGHNHTLFLTDKGVVYSCGDNKYGQLGLGNQTQQACSPQRLNYRGPPIRKVCCGADFSMIADIRGNLYSFGCPEYGQLGHNTDGKYFVTSNKLSFKCELSPRKVNVWIEKSRDGRITPILDVEARDIACGINHTVIIDSKKRVFTWGFGGYGRLGHADPKDEMVPRMVKFFEGPNKGAVKIAAGSTFSFALNEYGALYLWGLTKPVGEAAMYPKLVQDLSGWRVRSIGCCNKSIVVAADESVVAWGCSPTYGELGYGEGKQKSSTQPQEVRTLDKVYIQGVACGYSHSMLIGRSDTQEEKERIEKMPLYTPV